MQSRCHCSVFLMLTKKSGSVFRDRGRQRVEMGKGRIFHILEMDVVPPIELSINAESMLSKDVNNFSVSRVGLAIPHCLIEFLVRAVNVTVKKTFLFWRQHADHECGAHIVGIRPLLMGSR